MGVGTSPKSVNLETGYCMILQGGPSACELAYVDIKLSLSLSASRWGTLHILKEGMFLIESIYNLSEFAPGTPVLLVVRGGLDDGGVEELEHVRPGELVVGRLARVLLLVAVAARNVA